MGRRHVARRELASLGREKTILLAITIQLFVAAFSSFMLVGLVALYDPGSAMGAGVTFAVAGGAADDLAASIEGEGPWRVARYDDVADARTAFDRGRVDAALIATPLQSGAVEVEAVVPDESVRSTVIVVQVREALSNYERDRRATLASRLDRRPVSVPGTPGSTPTLTFTYTVLLPLLVFLPGFVSGSIGVDALTEEFDAGTLDLLRVTPLSAAEIVDGKLIAMTALAPVQAGAWLALLRFNGTKIAHPVALLVLATAVALVLVALGMGLAVVLRDRRSAQLVYSFGVLIVFGAAALLPETPHNVVAKLALDSPTAATYAVVVGFAAAAVAAYLLVRTVAAPQLDR